MRRTVTAVAAGLALLAASGGSAFAQSAEAHALGLKVSQATFRALPLEALISKATESGAKDAFSEVKSRPEWAGYLADALAEELKHDMPTVERLVGTALARSLTIEELRAGVTIMEDPGMQKAIAASAAGKTPAVNPSPSAERALGTAAGRSFLEKMEGIDKIMAPLLDEFLIELMPGALRRFADKIDAGEARRAASPR